MLATSSSARPSWTSPAGVFTSWVQFCTQRSVIWAVSAPDVGSREGCSTTARRLHALPLPCRAFSFIESHKWKLLLREAFHKYYEKLNLPFLRIKSAYVSANEELLFRFLSIHLSLEEDIPVDQRKTDQRLWRSAASFFFFLFFNSNLVFKRFMSYRYSWKWLRARWCKSPPWRNRLARSAVNREVGGSSPPGGGWFFFRVFVTVYQTTTQSTQLYVN